MQLYQYKHIFFDLDHTLWDHDRNSRETLDELYDHHKLVELGLNCKTIFWQTFDAINRELWDRREKDLLPIAELRSQRNQMLVERFNLASQKEEALVRFSDLNISYLSRCPAKPHLLPYAQELLKKLHGRYHLHILTNGFSEIQAIKLQASGIAQYFDSVVTPEHAGTPKPNKAYFAYVLGQLAAEPSTCLMIGDNLDTDIMGAMNLGIDSVYLNTHAKRHNLPVTKDISCLSELLAYA